MVTRKPGPFPSALPAILLLLLAPARGLGVESETVFPAEIVPLEQAVLNYAEGDTFAPFARFAESLRALTPEERAAAEQTLLTLLEKPGVTRAARLGILSLLELVAGPASAEPLARLLTDPVMSHPSRRVLEGLDSPQVNTLLLAGLRESEGDLRIGMIGSLGRRRAPEAVQPMVELTGSADPATARAALNALGAIGTVEAASALGTIEVPEPLEPDRLEALLTAGDALRRSGSNRTAAEIADRLADPAHPIRFQLGARLLQTRIAPGESAAIALELLQSDHGELVAAGLGLVAEARPAEATRDLAALLSVDRVPTVDLLDGLVARGDIAARPAILALTNSEDTAARAAALRALGTLGSPDEVDLLVARLQAGRDEAAAAEDALSQLPQIEVDIELLRRYRTFEEPPASALAAILGRRSNRAAVPFMLEAALREDRIGRESVRALAVLSEPSDVPELIALLDLVPSNYRRGVEQAVTAAVRRSAEDPPPLEPVLGAYAAATPANKLSLLRIAGAVGGPEAADRLLQVHRAADSEQQAVVLEILATTGDSRYLDLLRTIAAETEDPLVRTPLIRSGLRLADQWPDWKSDEAILIIASFTPFAQTVEEKGLILAAAADRKTEAALEIIESYLNVPELAEEAQTAATAMAEALKSGE